MNIIEAIQEKLGYSHIEKVDPNTNQVKNEDQMISTERLEHAATASMLAGFYKQATNDKDDDIPFKYSDSENWVDIIFGDKANEAAEKVASFAYADNQAASTEMNKVGNALMDLYSETSGDHNADTFKSWIVDQRNNILPYLPPELHLGETFNDNTIDDRTNKMEGPISGLMHAIEKAFSGKQEPKPID